MENWFNPPNSSMTGKPFDAVRGGFPGGDSLEFRARIAAASLEEVDPVYSGMVGQLTDGSLADDSGHIAPEWTVGLDQDSVMPLFMWANSTDPDVQNYGGDPATERNTWVSIMPHPDGNQALFLVAGGDFELASSQYKSNDNFGHNDFLTSATTGADAGKVELGTVYTDMICGQVSRGFAPNGHGGTSLFFWSRAIPPVPGG